MLDNLDLQILQEFYKIKIGEEVSAWSIMKKIYPTGKKREYELIKLRINKMSGKGLFKINGNKIKIYSLDLDRVFIQKTSFPTRRRKSISVEINGKFTSFEI